MLGINLANSEKLPTLTTKDSYVVKEGFVWISYISYSGERHYIATGTHNGSERTSTWGSFRE